MVGLSFFVETSAIVAMLQKEAEAGSLARRLAEAGAPITSPLVILEAAMVLSTLRRTEPSKAEASIRKILREARVETITIDDVTASLAVEAFSRFGKGRGNAAKLNMSDCLSYACAKQHRVPLLYVGDDFAATDLV